MNIGKKEITVFAGCVAIIMGLWNFGDKLIGENGLIATNKGVDVKVDYKYIQLLEQLNDNGSKIDGNALGLTKIHLMIVEKEITYTRKRCGIKPLDGDCLKDSEKLYYVDLIEQKKELKEDIKRLENK
jgi:hypothetical protein